MGNVIRHLDLVVLLIALPIFLVAGWPMLGYLGGAVAWLAQRGILAAPGEFYGPRGARHVRVALTATDERIAAAATRLSS